MKTIEELQAELDQLTAPKELAIRDQNYERAAAIRDQQTELRNRIEELQRDTKRE